LLNLLNEQDGATSIEDRKLFAAKAFNTSSHYDTAIFNYFNTSAEIPVLKQSIQESQVLRYGENPHQKGVFFGKLDELFEQLNGKELSYNNLLDIDAAVSLIEEFEEPTFAILKHNNACGVATRTTIAQAYTDAFSGDPVSAFGGVLIANRAIDIETANLMNSLFFEVLLAPGYDAEALEILKSKKNRVILHLKGKTSTKIQQRTILNGILVQDRDLKTESKADMTVVTKLSPAESDYSDLVFANKLVKHTKSNTIVLAKNGQLLASGTGQTSRVDALRQAIAKAKSFNFDLNGAVMASDAFFPFPDCVGIAFEEGIKLVIQPGGSIKDNESIAFCDANGMAMVTTGVRHFKH